MKNLLLLILLSTSMIAYGKANKWVDTNGQVTYSDQLPPANVKTKTLHPDNTAIPNAASSVPVTSKTYLERETELKKSQLVQKEAADKAAQEQARQKEKQNNCASAQQNLRTLEQGTRMVEMGADGERSFVTDEQRQQRISSAQQDVSKFCN